MRHWITSFRLLTILPIYRGVSDFQSSGYAIKNSRRRRCRAGPKIRRGPARPKRKRIGPIIMVGTPHIRVLREWQRDTGRRSRPQERLPDFVANLDSSFLST